MNTRLEKIKAAGCYVDSALERFVGDSDLYLDCFDKLLADNDLEKLCQAVESGDPDETFHLSHKLKSVYANMGLTAMYEACVPIVETAGAGSCPKELREHCAVLIQQIAKLKEL